MDVLSPALQLAKARDEQAIRRLVDSWLAASRAGDVDKVLDLVADDVVFLAPGQPPLRGRAAFAERMVGNQDVPLDAQGVVEEVRVLNGWALLWLRLTVVMRPRDGGAPVRHTGHTLSFLRKQANGHWVLARDASLLAGVPHQHSHETPATHA